MGVYIRGMDMPKNCELCLCSAPYGCAVLSQTMTSKKMKSDKPDWCPLLEVKEPHGDLADVSEVKKCLHDLPDSEDKWGAIALLEWAMEKRCVIEAEGTEE